MNPSTISSVSLLIAKALESYGYESEPVFEYAGLDPKMSRDPNARYSYAAMTKLWEMATEITKDPAFGLRAASFWHPTTLHALGYSWLASSNLKLALERFVRYLKIVSTIAKIQFEEAEEDFSFILDRMAGYPPPADEAIDAGFAMIIRMCRISYGESFNPLRIVMQRHEPLCKEEFNQFFRAPIDYSASKNVIYFGKKELNTMLPTANAELARVNDKIVTEYLARLDDSAITTRAKEKLIDKLSTGEVSEEQIASLLNLSSRSLQRRLKDEDMTYKQLLDETRRELASQYIENSHLSINQITYLLGFSEPANFSRAFKRWNGVSPSQYRKSILSFMQSMN